MKPKKTIVRTRRHTPDQVREKLTKAIELRSSGLDIKDCYNYLTISKAVFYEWLNNNPDLQDQFYQAWLDYKRSLIKQTKKRNSTYLLQNDFKDRFKPIINTPETLNQTLNVFNQYNLNPEQRIKQIESKLLELQ